MRILLDTSAYSAFMRDHAGARSFVQEADEIFVTPVVLGELLAGFIRGTRAKRNTEILEEFLASSRVSVATIDEETAERYAVILDSLRRSGTPIATNDLWIAATAMQHGLRVVTLDRDFLKIKQILTEYIEG